MADQLPPKPPTTICSPVYAADCVYCLICKRQNGEECLFKPLRNANG